MTTHAIPAAPWQLGRSLELILLPLVLEPEFDEKNSVWTYKDNGQIWYWKTGEAFGEHFYDSFIYKTGDRIYVQEPWLDADWDDAASGKEISIVSDEWQPAHTMPIILALDWYAIADVRVCQCKDLSPEHWIKAGFYPPNFYDINIDSPQAEDMGQQAIARWNAAHPDYPWQGDLWVVVLAVEAIAP